MNKEKVISDRYIKQIIKSLADNDYFSLYMENDIYEICSSYFANVENLLKRKVLPSKSHIIDLIMSNKKFKNTITNLANRIAIDFIDAYTENEKNMLQEEVDKEKCLIQETKIKEKNKKLLSSFSKDQLSILKKHFNIEV